VNNALLALAVAYIAGAIPFGYLLVKCKTGRDVRRSGSGNIGATNVMRTTGLWIGVATLVLDIAKGWFAVWFMDRMTARDIAWMCAAAVAVMLGHIFPVFLRFRGGKAVAAFFGAWFYLAPLPAAAVLLLFAVTALYSRHVSMGSVVAAGSFPFGVWMVDHPGSTVVLAAFISGALVVWRHRDNLERIRAGTESVIAFRRPFR
jgi:glycerol-3-phosphate acyltransferase PlsY